MYSMHYCFPAGFEGAALALTRTNYGNTLNVPILLDEVLCFGDELALSQCHHASGHYYCSHYKDAGVICQGEKGEGHSCSWVHEAGDKRGHISLSQWIHVHIILMICTSVPYVLNLSLYSEPHALVWPASEFCTNFLFNLSTSTVLVNTVKTEVSTVSGSVLACYRYVHATCAVDWDEHEVESECEMNQSEWDGSSKAANSKSSDEWFNCWLCNSDMYTCMYMYTLTTCMNNHAFPFYNKYKFHDMYIICWRHASVRLLSRLESAEKRPTKHSILITACCLEVCAYYFSSYST